MKHYSRTVLAIVGTSLITSFSTAEEYNGFASLNYSDIELGQQESKSYWGNFTHFFDARSTYGPLNEFEYINRSGFISGFATDRSSHSKLSDYESDGRSAGLSGGAFLGNLYLGAGYSRSQYESNYGTDADNETYSAEIGYLINDDIFLSVEHVDWGGSSNNTNITGAYEMSLGGKNYIGYTAQYSFDDSDSETRSISTRWFNALGNDRYLALGAGYTHIDDEDYSWEDWTISGDYYFTSRTSVGIEYDKQKTISLSGSHYLNKNLSLSATYRKFDDEERYGDYGDDFSSDGFILSVRYQY